MILVFTSSEKTPIDAKKSGFVWHITLKNAYPFALTAEDGTQYVSFHNLFFDNKSLKKNNFIYMRTDLDKLHEQHPDIYRKIISPPSELVEKWPDVDMYQSIYDENVFIIFHNNKLLCILTNSIDKINIVKQQLTNFESFNIQYQLSSVYTRRMVMSRDKKSIISSRFAIISYNWDLEKLVRWIGDTYIMGNLSQPRIYIIPYLSQDLYFISFSAEGISFHDSKLQLIRKAKYNYDDIKNEKMIDKITKIKKPKVFLAYFVNEIYYLLTETMNTKDKNYDIKKIRDNIIKYSGLSKNIRYTNIVILDEISDEIIIDRLKQLIEDDKKMPYSNSIKGYLFGNIISNAFYLLENKSIQL
jgi:hypothetical protein